MANVNPPQAFRSTLYTHRKGLRSEQPTVDRVLPGTLYYVTDEETLEIATKIGWETYVGAGASSFNLINYSFSVNTASPPSTNQIRFNALFPYTGVTKLYFDNVSADGMRILPGSKLYVQRKNDHTQSVVFRVIGQPIEHPNWIEFNVLHIAHNNAIGGGQLVLIQSIIGPIGTL
jgi:hypothetical protein